MENLCFVLRVYWRCLTDSISLWKWVQSSYLPKRSLSDSSLWAEEINCQAGRCGMFRGGHWNAIQHSTHMATTSCSHWKKTNCVCADNTLPEITATSFVEKLCLSFCSLFFTLTTSLLVIPHHSMHCLFLCIRICCSIYSGFQWTIKLSLLIVLSFYVCDTPCFKCFCNKLHVHDLFMVVSVYYKTRYHSPAF